MLLLCALAHAENPGLGLRLAGEFLQDPSLSVGYGSSSLSGEGVVVLPLANHLEVGAVVGYRRLGGNLIAQDVATESSSWIWYAPITLNLGLRAPVGGLDVYGNIGPTMVIWAEQTPIDLGDGIGTSGGKYGISAETGLSVPIAVQHSLHDPEGGPAGLEVFGSLGYRQTFLRHADCPFESPCGLSFSAVRASVGLMLRL